MKLSSIQAVGSTVSSDRSSPIAEKILDCWGYDRGTVQLVRMSSNFVFMFRQQGIKRFLRFSPGTERQTEQIEAEIKWLKWLANRGIRVSEPIASVFGNFVETVNTDFGTFHAVVFTALNGNQYELDDLNESQYRDWGAALGSLHSSFKVFDTYELQRPSYSEHLNFIRQQISDDDPIVFLEWETIMTWIESLQVTRENFGLIHFDFELDNLCWEDGTIQMLDFDDCAYHWYAADIALALRDLFEDKVDFANAHLKDFLMGYRSHCSIDEVLIENLPLFLRLGNLFRYANLIRSVDLTIDKTHDWLKPLHKKLTQSMERYRLSLVSLK